ncbi:MAG TPA: DUF883 C-terminal domain-containing protein [Opitutaceae bacterium]|jgi:ElaB/YqjD/DUF883 family membrane-anchored ribosome-binding protein|nr:DUF883 C-terminal domain-containing protein [Opitutaceae bacterium]
MTKTIAHRSHVAHRNGSDSNLRSLLTQAKSTISDVGTQTAENVQALRDRLSSTVSAAQKRAKAVAKAARRQASRADDAIRAKPYHAMAIAGGVGLVAGLLIARRRSAR